MGKNFCVDAGDLINPATDKVVVATWRFDPEPISKWAFIFREGVRIDRRNGPGDLFEYWAVTEPFHKSMSGGAVLLNGRVAAVISTGLLEDGKPAEGGYYANLLRYGEDAAWNGRRDDCSPAITNKQDFKRWLTQEKFFSGTCEGALAWIPNANKDERWNFPTNGNYPIRRADLSCDPSVCPCGRVISLKTVHMSLNHSVAKKDGVTCDADPVARLSAKARTYYGAQVVPIFASEARDTESPETWLYRATRLLRRQQNGSFDMRTAGPSAISLPIAPRIYNDITRQTDTASGGARCQGMSTTECEDVHRLANFDQWTEPRGQWHGYPRTKPAPLSTLGDRLTREQWTVPDNWLTSALKVKNFILPYTPTPGKKSSESVEFAFCVNPDWEGFYLRAFSPERGIRGEPIRVFLVR